MKKKLLALAVVLGLLSPALAHAGSSTDAALGLGAFAVFNQILAGTGIFGGLYGAPVVAAPAPVVVAPPPVVVAPPPPVIVAPPPRVVVAPPPVIVAPGARYYHPPMRIYHVPQRPPRMAPGWYGPGHYAPMGRGY